MFQILIHFSFIVNYNVIQLKYIFLIHIWFGKCNNTYLELTIRVVCVGLLTLNEYSLLLISSDQIWVIFLYIRIFLNKHSKLQYYFVLKKNWCEMFILTLSGMQISCKSSFHIITTTQENLNLYPYAFYKFFYVNLCISIRIFLIRLLK